MKFIILIIISLSLIGCNFQKENQPKLTNTDKANKVETETDEYSPNTDYRVAIEFINSYIKNEDRIGIIEWTKASRLVTDNFKNELENIVTTAWKNNPELGLGFNPIFDAQDYPDEGVNLFLSDSETGYVIVKGIKWGSFRLTMKVITENGKVLVDGCGIINIPKDKRIKR